MYASLEDLETRLAPPTLLELADDNGDGIPDSAPLEDALEDASAQIDLFLAGRYETPVDPAPRLLVSLAVDLAAHALFARRRLAYSQEWIERYASAVRMLADIAQGRLRVGGAALRDLPESTRRFDAKRFSATKLENY